MDLVNAGFKKVTGADYSEKAIDLARDVLKDRGITSVELHVCDITAPELDETLKNFKVVNDKGTYDAISLNPENSKDQRQKYITNLDKLLSPDGYFVITSCNWTREELTEHFQNCKFITGAKSNRFFNVCYTLLQNFFQFSDFQVIHEIPTKTFTFGGKTGRRVTQLVLKKTEST